MEAAGRGFLALSLLLAGVNAAGNGNILQFMSYHYTANTKIHVTLYR